MSQRIQSYEVMENIGYGGMAKVMKVRHHITGEIRAMKMLYEQFAIDPHMRERFEEEARNAGRLRHPNIVQVYDYITEGNNLCIIMEYIDGKPLSKVIGKEVGPIVPEVAIPIFMQIASAIEHAHNLPKPLIHRDIKPSNILITKDKTAKVTDFGIAKVLGGDSHTATGTMLGTLEYMSPEQMNGKDVDQRSDVYSLGMTLYEMLAGRLPFGFGSQDSMLDKIRVINQSKIPDPRDYYPHIPEYLVEIIRKAIQKDKNLRFKSVSDFIEAIEIRAHVASPSLESFAPESEVSQEIKKEEPVSRNHRNSETVAQHDWSGKLKEDNVADDEDEDEEEESGSGSFYPLVIFLVAVIGGLIYLIIQLLKHKN